MALASRPPALSTAAPQNCPPPLSATCECLISVPSPLTGLALLQTSPTCLGELQVVDPTAQLHLSSALRVAESSPRFLVKISRRKVILCPCVVVQSLSCVRLFATPWTAARQASLSFTIWSWLKLMSLVTGMPSNHLTLCRPLLFLPSISPSIRVFSNESALCIRWPKYWSFSISPSNEYSGLISFRIGVISLLSKGLSRVFSNTTVQKHQFFSAKLSLWSSSYIHT